MPYVIAVFVMGLIATALSVRILAGLGVVDVPNHRSSHSRPTVRGAGVGVALCSIGAASVAAGSGPSELWVIASATAAFAALGLLDDLRPLGVAVRLPSQLLLAVIAIVLVAPPGGPGTAVLAAVFIIGYVNAFNFMDGINGISGLHAAAVGATWALAGGIADEPIAILLGGIAAAGALAFLPFNIPRARAFLGDVGSYFFGGWIAISGVILISRLPLVLLALPVLPYIADTGWTLARRVSRGETWHEAHREHVYQRLVQAGWSHTGTSILMGTLTVLCGAAGLVAAELSGGMIAIPVSLAGIACAAYLSLPRLVGERLPHP